MTKKWQDFWIITSAAGVIIPAEIGWTTFLVWSTSKIPYIGIPIATLMGITGAGCTLFLGNGYRFACQDWYKRYHTK